MSEHTLGPWRNTGTAIRGADGSIVVDLRGALAGSGNTDADASLIAAAPDLLRACRAIASAELPPIPEPDADGYYPAIEFGRISMMHKMQAMAREAVAKATGGPHGRGDGVD